MIKFKLFFCIFTLLSIIGCKPVISPSTTSTLDAEENSESYSPTPYPFPYAINPTPVPDLLNDTYPGPVITPLLVTTEEGPFVIPTPTDDTGVVTGQLLNKEDQKPLVNALYLADIIPAEQEGFAPIISLSENSSSLAKQDIDGRFYFEGITPGSYALALWGPLSSIIITESDSETYLVFEVQAGKTVDLGIIYIP